MPPKRQPDTSPIDRSIWQGVDRNGLEKLALQLQKRVVEPRDYTRHVPSAGDSQYPFSFEVERQLADDFAFIAASASSLKQVSAACLECDPSGHPVIVRFAANEGIDRKVNQSLDQLFSTLHSCAKRDTNRETCRQSLFDIIVHINTPRILERLGPRKPKDRKERNRDDEPLPTRLQSLAKSNIRRFKVRQDKSVLALRTALERFKDAYERLLEENDKQRIQKRLQATIIAAYNVTRDESAALPSRLRGLGFSNDLLDHPDIRQIIKIARYWRVCITFADSCRSYRRQFENLRCTTITPYKDSHRSNVLTQPQHIHAEIQLIAFYELHPGIQKPRAIGASKDACFLCDSFIRAHATFSVTRAHRQVYPRWTVPDLKQFRLDTIRRFRRSLNQVVQDLKVEASKPSPRRQSIVQSSDNLMVPAFRTPSISTLRSGTIVTSAIRGNPVPSTPTTPSIATMIEQGQTDEGTPSVIEDSSRSSQTSLTMSVRNRSYHGIEERETAFETTARLAHKRVDSMTQDQEALNLNRWRVSSVPTTIEHSDWLSLRTSMVHPAPQLDRSPGKAKRFSSGSVRIKAMTKQSMPTQIIDLKDIPFNQDLVLVRDDANNDSVISFGIRKNSEMTVLVQCRWLF